MIVDGKIEILVDSHDKTQFWATEYGLHLRYFELENGQKDWIVTEAASDNRLLGDFETLCFSNNEFHQILGGVLFVGKYSIDTSIAKLSKNSEMIIRNCIQKCETYAINKAA